MNNIKEKNNGDAFDNGHILYLGPVDASNIEIYQKTGVIPAIIVGKSLLQVRDVTTSKKSVKPTYDLDARTRRIVDNIYSNNSEDNSQSSLFLKSPIYEYSDDGTMAIFQPTTDEDISRIDAIITADGCKLVTGAFKTIDGVIGYNTEKGNVLLQPSINDALIATGLSFERAHEPVAMTEITGMSVKTIGTMIGTKQTA